MRNIFLALAIFILLFSCKNTANTSAGALTADPFSYTIQKKFSGSNGAVVSAHPLASMIGVHILREGGNAFDAAIATQLALAVVYPGAGNIGGGGFMVARTTEGENIAIDYREKAPGKASRDMYLDSAGNAILDKSQNGHLAAGIPGTVAGLFASMKYAKLSFKQLIQPAIELAEHGFAVTEDEANDLNELQETLKANNTVPNVFQKQTAWKAGDTLLQKDLSQTLKRIRDDGQKGFYEGETAKLIAEEMKRGNGIISLDDLKNYEAAQRKPVEFDYKGYHIISMPLPSSGGIILEQCLKMIEEKNIASMGFQSPAAVQLITEAERRAYADRAEYLGDADFINVPVATLTNSEYLKQRMKDYIPGKAGSSQQIKAGAIKESEETTHLSIVDKWGNMVAVTTTLNGGYGSRTVVGGAGFFLNNEMDDFSVKPGVPNMYGALGTEANAIQPGKRMLSSMTPTIVLKDNKPFMVVGTPGGTTIPTSVLQSILNIVEFGLSAEDAVNKPKFHHQWMPDVIFTERDFSETVIDSLKTMGYSIEKRGQIGRTELIRIQKGNTDSTYTFEAIADKRGDDAAEGY